jgi:hypothetical protein
VSLHIFTAMHASSHEEYMKLNLGLFVAPVTGLFLNGMYAHIFSKPINMSSWSMQNPELIVIFICYFYLFPLIKMS